MQHEPVVFTSTVEGLIRALGTKLDSRAQQRFAELGLPLRGKLQAAYPRDVWLKAAVYGGELMFPELPPEKQRREVGRRFIMGYSETVVGKALLGLLRVLGPRRSLARLERSFHTGNNYSKATLRETEQGLELDIGDAPYPEWYQGMVEAALELTGAKDIEVAPIRREGLAVTFSVRFR